MSFSFWTGHVPPTALNINHPLAFFTDAQQHRVIDDLRRVNDLCVVIYPELLAFLDRGQIDTNPPLLRHIRDDYTQVAERDGYIIMRRRDATR